jgi:hypothetical protein
MTVNKSRVWALTAVALVLGFVAFAATSILWAIAPERFARPDPVPVSTFWYDDPARYQPPAVAAAKADLATEEPVIGVQIAGRTRAYRRSALEGKGNHVINDVVAGRPVTVTYCDRKRCARVYSGDGPGPLHVREGGYDDGLLLLVGTVRYRQDTGAPATPGIRGALPHGSIEFVETTWGRWQSDHPDTDMVTGSAPGDLVGG